MIRLIGIKKGDLDMKIDTYTKGVQTTIAILLGLIVFDYKPIQNAEANQRFNGKYAIASGGFANHAFIIDSRNARYRLCSDGGSCGDWYNGQ